MKVSLNKICSSSVTTILLLFIYACALAIATFIENTMARQQPKQSFITLLYSSFYNFH